jgi:carbonic anhydrase/acetyltransferase-like protein (isoleucine patch superfamily)
MTMKLLSKTCLLFLGMLCLHQRMYAQYVYTITADSVKLTSCDSSELIIMNHTQNVPGFLFNTGNGRTIFQRGAQSLGGGVYLIGADTIKTSSNAWVQGGNSFSTTGILGTLDYNHLDFYTNNTQRMRVTNAGRVGIGIAAPVEALDVSGNMNINDVVDQPIAAYKIDDQPILSFGTNVGQPYNICVGDSAGYNVTGAYRYTFLGYKSGMNNVGGANVLIGDQAGMDDSGTGDTFVGSEAGVDAEGGSNTFVGYVAGGYCSGTQNTFLGQSSGAGPTGSGNTYTGYYSGGYTHGDYNVELGYESGWYSYGSNNIFLGQSSGASNGGNDNVFVGSLTAISDTGLYHGWGVNEVTLLGDSSDVVAFSSISNATALGHKAVVRSSNSMVFGDSLTTNWFFNSAAAPVSGAALVVGSNSSNGNGAYLSTGGTWTNASDRNKKENFQRLDGDAILKKISRLPLTRWNYKGQSEQHIGPVAQDFYRIFQVGENDKTISTIDPSGIALIGVQELYKKWKAAEKKVETLQSTIQSQEERLRRLEEKINQLSEKSTK